MGQGGAQIGFAGAGSGFIGDLCVGCSPAVLDAITLDNRRSDKVMLDGGRAKGAIIKFSPAMAPPTKFRFQYFFLGLMSLALAVGILSFLILMSPILAYGPDLDSGVMYSIFHSLPPWHVILILIPLIALQLFMITFGALPAGRLAQIGAAMLVVAIATNCFRLLISNIPSVVILTTYWLAFSVLTVNSVLHLLGSQSSPPIVNGDEHKQAH